MRSTFDHCVAVCSSNAGASHRDEGAGSGGPCAEGLRLQRNAQAILLPVYCGVRDAEIDIGRNDATLECATNFAQRGQE